MGCILSFVLLCFYLLTGEGEEGYSKAGSNFRPHRAVSLTRGPYPSPGSPRGVGVDSEGGVRGSGALLLLFFVD